MWIELNKGEMLNLSKVAYIRKDELEWGPLILFCRSHKEWYDSPEDDEYAEICGASFNTKEERDAKFEEIKAMLIKRPLVELT